MVLLDCIPLEWYGQIHLCILMDFVQPLICQDCMAFLGHHHKGHHCFTHKWPTCAFSSFLWYKTYLYRGISLDMKFSDNTTTHCVDFVCYNIFPHFGGDCVDLRVLPKNLGVHFHNQGDLMFPSRNHMINSIWDSQTTYKNP